METRVKLTKLMYGWSKWGGVNQGLVKELLVEWHCQVCGELQSNELPSYMFPLESSGREFARVCSKCKHAAIENEIEELVDLIRLIRGE